MRYAIEVQADDLKYYNSAFPQTEENSILLAIYCHEGNVCIWKLISREQLQSLKQETVVMSFNDNENFLFAGRKKEEKFLPSFPLSRPKTV